MRHETITRQRWQTSIAVPLLVVLVLWAARALYFGEPWFALDDAYIYGHNAEVLLRGSDPNYGVSPLYGTTSAPFLLILAALSIFLPMPWALEVSGLVGALLYIAGAWRLGRDLPFGWRMGGATVALFAGLTIHHLTNGLETGLAMAAVLWAIVGMIERSRWLGLLTGILPFIRIDLAPLAAMIWLTDRDKGRHSALAALTAIPFALWFLIETGFPVSLTGYAKQLYFDESATPWPLKLKNAGTGFFVWLVTMNVTALGFVLLPRRVSICLAGFAAVFLAVGLAKVSGAFYMYEGRYFCPFVPFAVAGIILSGRKQFIAAAAAVGLIFFPMWWGGTHVRLRNVMVELLRPLPEWPREHLPPDARVLVHDAGLIAVETDLRMTDVVGLKSPSSIEALRRHPGDRAAALAEMAVGHDYLIEHPGWDIDKQLRSKGWTLTRVNPPDAFLKIYRLEPPK